MDRYRLNKQWNRAVFISSCILILMIAACVNETDEGSRIQDFDTVKAVSICDTLQINRMVSISQDKDSLVIATPMRILNIGEKFLVVTENRSENFINVFSLPDLSYLYSFGTVSNGPNPEEFQSVPIYFNASGNELISYDGLSRQLRYIELNDTTISKTREVSLSYDGQMDPLNRVRRVRDDLYFADYGSSFENTDKEHIALKPGVEDSLFTFGRYPESDLEGFERYGQFMKENAAKPDGSRFATFYFRYNAFKIFTSDGERIEATKVNDSLIEDSLAQATNDILFRSTAAASDNYIYTVGYYTSRENVSTPDSSSTSFFEVWNWDGKPVYRSSFDRFIDNFTVSEMHQKIYAYNKSNDDTIYEYNLPLELQPQLSQLICWEENMRCKHL